MDYDVMIFAFLALSLIMLAFFRMIIRGNKMQAGTDAAQKTRVKKSDTRKKKKRKKIRN